MDNTQKTKTTPILIGVIVLLVIIGIIYLAFQKNPAPEAPASAPTSVTQATSVPAPAVPVSSPTKAPATHAPAPVTSNASYAPGTCYKFTTDLSLNSSGPEVTALQNFLTSNGFAIAGVSNGTTPKGFFGSQTLAALRAYQQSVGLTPNNQYAFDIVTRAYINDLCGKVVAPAPSALILATDPATPPSATVRVNSTSNGQYLGLSLLTFNLDPQDAAGALRSLSASLAMSGAGQAITAYLYQGSTLVSTASVVQGKITFSGFDPVSLPANAHTPFTIKVDFNSITTSMTVSASVSAAGVTAVNSSYGRNAEVDGSAQGKVMTITQ